MPQANSAIIRPSDVLQTVTAHPWRLILPTAICTALALLYVWLAPVSWEATQALLVRDEAVGNTVHPGRFSHVEEMKTAQETVLELIKSRSVLSSALAAVGPPADYRSSEPWPSAAAVEGLQQTIKLTPPKGAEFGKTEVFYLKVSAPQRQRAIDLAAAVCRQLAAQFEHLRVSKYQSVIDELTNTVALANNDLTQATETLSAVERKAGRDLAELRTLNETPSGDSALRRMANEIETELRTYRALANSNQELLDLLEGAKDDPGRLLASPSRLLEAQPALRRLKDGLVDAQLRTAQLQGTMSPAHPAVQSAIVAEQAIGGHLHDEIGIAIKGLRVDLRLASERVAALDEQRAEVQSRLAQLADIRAQYANLLISARHRSDMYKTAQQELSEARAGQAAAHTSSLLTLIDLPDPGSKPAGPGRTTVVLAGVLGGVIIGLGILFLSVQPALLPVSMTVVDSAAPATASLAQLNVEVAAIERTVVEPAPLAPVAVRPAPQAPQPVQQPGRKDGTYAAGSLTLKQALQKLVNEPASLN
jgi:polysaccharide biosynthesis transport protein